MSKVIRTDINSLRYNIAIEKNPGIVKLPPSKPAMLKHSLRALWQIDGPPAIEILKQYCCSYAEKIVCKA